MQIHLKSNKFTADDKPVHIFIQKAFTPSRYTIFCGKDDINWKITWNRSNITIIAITASSILLQFNNHENIHELLLLIHYNIFIYTYDAIRELRIAMQLELEYIDFRFSVQKLIIHVSLWQEFHLFCIYI